MDEADAGWTFAIESLWPRALRFDERDAVDVGATDAVADARLGKWCRHVADGDTVAFRRRLGWDGWTEAGALAALSPMPAAAIGSPLPPWAQWLQRQMRAPFACNAVEPDAMQRDIVPAQTLWRAWVLRASVDASLDADEAGFAACAPLRAALVEHLADLAAATLTVDAADWRGTSAHTTSYTGWLQSLAGSRLPTLLQGHPRLARQLAEATCAALASQARLLQRLRADSGALCEHFGSAFAALPCRIRTSGADLHRGGQQVLCLEYAADGDVLYYKPRSLAAEAAFDALLHCLPADAAPLPLPPRLLDRGDYGYVEAAPADAIALTADECARYFARFGSCVALAWVLNARDLHQDNLIATRHGPVLIDLETLLQPTPRAGDGTFARAHSQNAASCLASGLLRFPQQQADGRLGDGSALRGELRHYRRVWSGLADLQFVVRREPLDLPPAHRPRDAAGRAIDPLPHAQALLDGFTATLELLRVCRDRLCVAGGVFDAMQHVPVRIAFRPSQAYADLLRLLATPAWQRDGATAIVAIDAMNRPFCQFVQRPPWWPLVRSERMQLETGDIPLFTLAAGARGFASPEVPDLFAVSGLDTARQRLASLDDDGIAEQVALLQAALSPAQPSAAARPARAAAISADACRAACLKLGDQLLAAAVHGDDGLMTWPVLADAQTSRGHGGDYYLYQGALGIAWAMAAVAANGGESRHRNAVAAVLRSLHRVFDSAQSARLLQQEPLGAAHGLGSLVLGLLAIARIEPTMPTLPLARRVAATLTPERIAAEPHSDLHSGVAGALLALAALQAAAPDALFAEAANACVQRLRALSDGNGLPRGYAGLPLAGAAHGLTGIAHALSHAAVAFARPDWRRWAESLVQAEDAAFDAASGNWRQRLDGANGVTGFNAWCNGAGGILLLREAARLPRSDAAERALAVLADAPCAAVEHLCCGSLGRADMLLALAHCGEPGLQPVAQAMAGAVAARLQSDALRFDHAGRRPPGLYRGVSGVAVGLLRCFVDARLPSPLLFGLPPMVSA